MKFSTATSPAILKLSLCNFMFRSSTLKFVVLDYDKFSRSEFIAEVMLSLLDVDLAEGTTMSLHLNSKTISEVSILCNAKYPVTLVSRLDYQPLFGKGARAPRRIFGAGPERVAEVEPTILDRIK